MLNNNLNKIEEKIKNATKYDIFYKNGLSSQQVKQRYKDGLVNKESKSGLDSYLKIVFKNLFNFLNINLFIIAVILIRFKLYNRLYFLCAFLSNFLISLFNDLKVKRIIGNLSLILNKKITVIRDSVKKEIFFNELVFSDVILLKVGDVIPCDSKVIFGNVFVNESFLTGETDDIEKKEGSKLLAKSFIVNGTCYAEIIGISNTSYIVKVQEKLRSFLRPKSQIIKFLNKIIFFNTFLAFAISLIKLIFFVRRNGWNLNVEFVDSTTSSFLTMLSVGMYLMISIIITVDIVDLYINHKVLINEPYSFEMIARSNVFCFDKTGTLTTGKMEVKELIPIKKNDLNFLEKIISQIIYLNKDENLTAKALKKYFPFKESILLESNQYSNIPFNSKNKYSAISYNGNTYVLGAADFIEIENIEVKKIVKNYEKEGFRVLVVAKNNKKIFNHKVVGTFIVIGILVLCEEIRTNIVENLNNLKANNIDSYIISGDSEIFLSAIAKKINFDNNVICLKNLDINKISDAIKNKYKIFARATPEQKKIIVDELKKQNKVVSMVGDGLNDLLALKSANCSIAISNENNSITKSVSNIILFNSDFSDLKKIIEISKRNINKIKNACILFLTKAISLLILNFIFFMFNINFKYRVNNFFVWEIVSVAIAPFFISLEKNNKENIEDNFAIGIIRKLVPSVITQLINFLLMFLIFKKNDEEFICLSTISISFIALSFLIYAYLPLTKFRLLIFSFSFIFTCLIFIIDKIINLNVFNVNYDFISKKNILLLFLLILFLNFVYFLLIKFWNFIINKITLKNKTN